jgi:hypothetical protein
MERVLHPGGRALRPRPQHARRVRLVAGEQQLGRRRVQVARAQTVGVREVPERLGGGVVGDQAHEAVARGPGPDRRRGPRFGAPGPGVAEPEVRQHVQRRRVGPPVPGGDAHHDVLRRGLRVLDEDVEVAAVLEDPGVEQLVLGPARLPPLVLQDELRVRVRALRVLVEVLQVRVRRRGVEVEVRLLHVLAVVALGRHQAEEALLQDRVALVPEREAQAEDLVAVAEAREAVLPPAVGLAARVVVREVVPGRAVRAVVLADGAPRAIGHVRPPAPPGDEVAVQARQPFVLGGGRRLAGGPGAAHRYFSIVALARSDSTKARPCSACLRRRTSSRMNAATVS